MMTAAAGALLRMPGRMVKPFTGSCTDVLAARLLCRLLRDQCSACVGRAGDAAAAFTFVRDVALAACAAR